MDFVRIRNNGIIKPLNISEDELKHLNDVLKSERISPWRKEALKKEITGKCCVCGGIPSMMISYDVQEATQIERYCEKCIKSVYAREQVI